MLDEKAYATFIWPSVIGGIYVNVQHIPCLLHLQDSQIIFHEIVNLQMVYQ